MEEKNIKKKIPKVSSRMPIPEKKVKQKVDGKLENGQVFDTMEAFKVGWEIFKKKPWFLIGVSLFVPCFDLVIDGVQKFLTINESASGVIMIFILEVASFVVGIVLGVGLIDIFLRVYDNKSVNFNLLFKKANLFWVFLGSTIVTQFIIFGGMMFFIVPGIIAIIALMFVSMIVVDRNTGVMEAIKISWAITDGYKGKIFVFMLVAVVVNFLGALALLVGLLVTIPVSYIATIYIYRKLLDRAELKNKVAVEKLQTMPRVFLWAGVLFIPFAIFLGIVFVVTGIARGL